MQHLIIKKLQHNNLVLENIEINEANQENEFKILARLKNIFSSSSESIAKNDSIHNEQHSIALSELIKEYEKEKLRSDLWKDKTHSENMAIYDLLLKVIGDIDVITINSSTSRFFKKTILDLPPNINKRSDLEEKSIDEIIKLNIEPKLSNTTANKYLNRVSSLFKWARKQGYVQENFFDDLQLKSKKSDEDDRSIYTDNDLLQVFSTPQYTELNFIHNHYYWLPLLALYSGARLNELCQLHVSDVYLHTEEDINEDGNAYKDKIWVMDINDENEKYVKNKSSKRLIPIHSDLIRLGFIDFVKSLEENVKTRLFEELKYGRDGYGTAASKWYSRYKSKIVLSDIDNQTFHSFRHTFINQLKQNQQLHIIVKELSGHHNSDITYGRYGKSYNLGIKRDAIESLNFSATLKNAKSFMV